MTKENDVYDKLTRAQSRNDVITLEMDYVQNQDWDACAIVATRLSETAETREETMKYIERSNLYWSRHFNNGKYGVAGNGG